MKIVLEVKYMAVSKKQQACVNRYMSAHYDRINLTVPKGYKEQLAEVAKANGESVNGYIKRLIDADLGKQGAE